MVLYKFYLCVEGFKLINKNAHRYIISDLFDKNDVDSIMVNGSTYILYAYTNDKHIYKHFKKNRNMRYFIKDKGDIEDYEKFIHRYPDQEIIDRKLHSVIGLNKFYLTRFEAYYSCIEKETMLYHILKSKMYKIFDYDINIFGYLDGKFLSYLIDKIPIIDYYNTLDEYMCGNDEMFYDDESYTFPDIDELAIYSCLFGDLYE